MGNPRRLSTPRDRHQHDALVALLLALLGFAAMAIASMLLGAGSTPADGPIPGMAG